jgi:hypothetical protein
MEGRKKDLNNIHSEIENGALVINGENSPSVNIYISVEDISLVEINGSTKLYATGNINSDILLLKVNGSGSMKLDVRTLAIGMIVKGSGKIIVSGSTGDSRIRIYGNGNVYTNDLDSFKSTEERTVINDSRNDSKRSTLKLHQ